MKELIDKISSYNIFNYLFPGILFAVLAKAFTSFDLVQEDVVLGVFVYYFLGLVISRVGSLVVEPILKGLGVAKFSRYEDYISASKHDPMLSILSEANNTYRTLIAVFLSLVGLKFYGWLQAQYELVKGMTVYVVILGLLILFVLAYRKQTEYVSKRVDAGKKGDREK